MDSAPMRAEWLSWDGARLRWRLTGDAAGLPATELRLDGIVFQRYPAAAESVHEFECEFAYSPSGWVDVAFSVAISGDVADIVLADWPVRCGEAADPADRRDAVPATDGLTPLLGTPPMPRLALSELPPVAVVVPIYNSPACVQRCLDALARWSPRARLILVDDASSDAKTRAILADAARRKNVLVHRNVRNRGYTHSVNVGMGMAGGADVVLLNSDTEVGPRWLVSLRIAAYSQDDVGTVTAVSDNAGAFTVPELEQHCPIPRRWDLVRTQRAVLQNGGLRYPQLPTGNGFCMYVKRVLIARIGPMDEAAFPVGYGEENDFCQRAERAGYRHLIAGNVLVHHERSASFGDARRAELGAKGMAVLRERYPNYERDVGATLFSFDRRVLDYRVRRTYAHADGAPTKAPRPRLLIAADDGDAAALRLLTAVERRQQAYLLCSEGSWVNLYRADGATLIFERRIPIGHDATALRQIEMRLREWLIEYAIESVHLRGSAASDGWLAGLAAELEIPVT